MHIPINGDRLKPINKIDMLFPMKRLNKKPESIEGWDYIDIYSDTTKKILQQKPFHEFISEIRSINRTLRLHSRTLMSTFICKIFSKEHTTQDDFLW